MRQSACLAFYAIMVDQNASIFNCTPVVRLPYSMISPTNSHLFKLVGAGTSSVAGPSNVVIGFFLLLHSILYL